MLLTNFSSLIGNFFINIGKNIYFFALGMGPFMGPGYIGRQIHVQHRLGAVLLYLAIFHENQC